MDSLQIKVKISHTIYPSNEKGQKIIFSAPSYVNYVFPQYIGFRP
jgi:hypothetical protein